MLHEISFSATTKVTSMGFSDFHGNSETVTRLREMMARDHFPHAVILAGPRGAGKYTLSQMVAKAMNCERRPNRGGLFADETGAGDLPDFCGEFSNCLPRAKADPPGQGWAEAVEAREGLRDTDKRETRILIQT